MICGVRSTVAKSTPDDLGCGRLSAIYKYQDVIAFGVLSVFVSNTKYLSALNHRRVLFRYFLGYLYIVFLLTLGLAVNYLRHLIHWAYHLAKKNWKATPSK